MGIVYSTRITELGVEAEEFIGSGLVILFAQGAPPELAEISALHEPTERRDEPPEPGDALVIGEREFRITAIGERAWKNMLELGHAVFKFNGRDEVELPGEIYLEETEPGDLAGLIKPGAPLEIRSGT